MSTSATQPVIAPSQNHFTLKVGTRKSALAVRQAEWVIQELSARHPHISFEIVKQDGEADVDKVTALYKFGGKGLWTNALEADLAANRTDFIVHCLKDMPTTLPDNMVIGCVTEREDPRDVVVVKKSLQGKIKSLKDLGEGAVVGTSSVRRIAQIKRKYPHLQIKDVRGNIDTRVNKFLDNENEPYSVLILAAAGLHRMEQNARIAQYLEHTTEGGGMLYAVGQGALAIEARKDDERVLKVLKTLEDTPTMLACEAERSLMRTLEGGCSIPIGVETKWVGENKLRFLATVVNVEGTKYADAEREAEIKTREDSIEFGKKIAQDLVDRGAQKILDAINQDREGSKENAAEK